MATAHAISFLGVQQRNALNGTELRILATEAAFARFPKLNEAAAKLRPTAKLVRESAASDEVTRRALLGDFESVLLTLRSARKADLVQAFRSDAAVGKGLNLLGVRDPGLDGAIENYADKGGDDALCEVFRRLSDTLVILEENIGLSRCSLSKT